VAGRMAGQALAGSAQSNSGANANQRTTRPVTIAGVTGPVDPRAAGRKTGQATGSVARGVGGFFKPFRQVGGKLWLEVTGVFFLLPVLVFGPTLWHTKASYAHGPDHRTFLVSAGVVVVFLYLGLSSFWRAWRK